MKRAMSNIAWQAEEAHRAYALLERHGYAGLEIAPGIAFAGSEDCFAPSESELREFQAQIAAYGLSPVSMQSLLFGVDGAELFGSIEQRAAFVRGVDRAIVLAGRLGIRNLVLGSPRNRSFPQEWCEERAYGDAAETLRHLGDRAVANGARIALEPNPAIYGTNFLTGVRQTALFVDWLSHPGIGLNFDLGALAVNGEAGDAVRIIRHSGDCLAHVHVSAPNLCPVTGEEAGLRESWVALADQDYPGWISIEMRRVPDDPLGAIEGALTGVARMMDTMNAE